MNAMAVGNGGGGGGDPSSDDSNNPFHHSNGNGGGSLHYFNRSNSQAAAGYPPRQQQQQSSLNLRLEADRLKTFSRWSNPAVPVQDLAKWGFFYTGKRDLVECTFCHGKLQDWRSCDDPRSEHERNYPDCPFVMGCAAEKHNNELNHFSFAGHTSSTDSATSSNAVPEYSYQTTLSVAVASNNFNRRPARTPARPNSSLLPTLVNRSSNNNSSSSSSNNSNATATSTTNHVTTTTTTGQSGNGNGNGNGGGNRSGNGNYNAKNNKVDYEHSYTANGKCMSPLEEELRKLGIYTSKPIISHMVTFQARQASFERWPKTSTQTADELAEAGFYYTGESDRTRCFYCGMALHNWLPEDNAWAEHEKGAEHCDYIKMCKNMMGGGGGGSGNGSVAGASGAPAGGNSGKTAQKKMIEENREVIREFFESIDEKGTLDDLDAKTPTWRGEEHVRFALEAGYDEGIISKALITNSCLMFTTALDLIDRIEALRIITESPSPDETTGGEDGANAEAAGPKIHKDSNRDSKLCQICMDAEISIVLLPCAHLVCCPRCSPALRNCPICRCESTGRLRIFM